MPRIANPEPVSAAALIVWSIVLSPLGGGLVLAAMKAEAARGEYSEPPMALWMLGITAGIAGTVTLCMGVYRLVRKIEGAARAITERTHERPTTPQPRRS
ncbi:hypothetical protein [Sanguibacter sp. HDW7]|uniref:hypothetical protein n=1 Tax=Sanguibacter sp. HDW7 TaxID=2714931 RepID=UPI00140E07A8|nr:hypothetical protein [Sanguibacter sp. HDW7]QIK83126.1 hypothetical protein G7063_05390 [Sanguibacter sp. HDW7]